MIPRHQSHSSSRSRTLPRSLPTVIAPPPELTLENASDTSDSDWSTQKILASDWSTQKILASDWSTQADSSRSRRVSQVSHCSSSVSVTSGWNPPEFVLNTASDSDSSRRVSTVSSQFSQFYHPSPVPALSPSPSVSRRFSAAAESHHAVHLDVPQLRERNYSLPSTVLTEEFYKMRMFSVKGRKVVNHGDTIQSRRGSRTSISSRGSGDSHSTTPGRTPRSGRSSALSSRGSSRPVSRQSSPAVTGSCPGSRRNSDRGYASSFRTSPLSAHSRCSSPCLLQLPRDEADLVRVLILGASGVGKSSLCAQFVTSEYVNTYHQVGEIFLNLKSIFFNTTMTRYICKEFHFSSAPCPEYITVQFNYQRNKKSIKNNFKRDFPLR